MKPLMPAIFYTEGWAAVGPSVPRPLAVLSVPTPDHYLPLLYVLGLRRKQDPLTLPVEGVDGGSFSMLSIQIG